MTTIIDPPVPDPAPVVGPGPDLDPPLAPAPPDGALHGLDPIARRAFRILNQGFMAPLIRADLGAWIGSPIGGYVLLLKVRGRRSGLTRETPLNYLVAEGSVWLVAGFGPSTAWYRNLCADPRVELWLPGRRVAGTAAEVRDPVIRARIMPPLLRSTGLAAFLGGVNPWRSSDDEIIDAVAFAPLIRIDADTGLIEAGPDDPGGRAWRWRQAVVTATALVAWRAATRLVRGRRRR